MVFSKLKDYMPLSFDVCRKAERNVIEPSHHYPIVQSFENTQQVDAQCLRSTIDTCMYMLQSISISMIGLNFIPLLYFVCDEFAEDVPLNSTGTEKKNNESH